MFYHDKFNKVVDDYKKGRITKKVALDRIRVIDYEAYSIVSDAEPDGDITYASACAAEEIESSNKEGD
jgi:hypothetical protein